MDGGPQMVPSKEQAMSAHVEHLVERMREAEHDLACEIEEQQERWHYRIERGRVWFEEGVRLAHQRLRQSVPAYIRTAHPLSLLTAPIVYSLLLPLVFLDASVWLYERVCFPIYGIALVPRRQYFVIDRRKLAYLNGIEKANCTFCSYANGLIAFVREVSARTEQYWCPIKHSRPIPSTHGRYHLFFDYGDAQAYRRDLETLRGTMRDSDHAPRRAPQRRGTVASRT
jgi:hypothetical protein